MTARPEQPTTYAETRLGFGVLEVASAPASDGRRALARRVDREPEPTSADPRLTLH